METGGRDVVEFFKSDFDEFIEFEILGGDCDFGWSNGFGVDRENGWGDVGSCGWRSMGGAMRGAGVGEGEGEREGDVSCLPNIYSNNTPYMFGKHVYRKHIHIIM